ncbi:MAG TPA: nuclear transport factor 2 family protein [Gemmataceae bacterium]|nr:nuclear transport factor 2 family protein [Gemmataceae bacterium]
MVSPVVIRKTVAAYFAATRAMDPEAWLATFAEDAVSYDPVGGVPIEGHRGLRQFYETITLAFDKVGITEGTVFVAGNQAAAQWKGHGLGKNGREVTFEGIDVFEINDRGKIQRLWGYWDPAPLMEELMS